jgi:PncC family amidohydrolase
MQTLLPLAQEIAGLLKERRETIAVCESSTGGLLSAALLAIPGASAYFLGAAVVYTARSRSALLGITSAQMGSMRAASEPYAALIAQRIRELHGSDWGLAETGATGPTGNRYGDPAGHTCIAVAGKETRAFTIRTGSSDRQQNMRRFAEEALKALSGALRS